MECGRLQRLAQSMPASSSLLNDLITSWKSAIRDPNPVVFLENEMLYGSSFPVSTDVLSDDFLLPIGKCKVEREGGDVTMVAHSKMVTHSLEAADELAKEGIKAEVINLRSIRPLDIHTIIKSVKKTNRYVLSICD
jgi:pyruvate dehydrogenase E1 component beta subunit